MTHFRYLGLIAGMVCVQAGTLDELHAGILKRNRRNGFRTDFEEIDTWTDPGRLVLEDEILKWAPAE